LVFCNPPMRFDKNGKRISPDGNGTGKSKDGSSDSVSDETRYGITNDGTFTDSFGTVDLTNKHDKEEHYGEIAHNEEARVKNAQREFHARMTESEKEEATKWIAYYRYMVGEGEKE